MKITNKSKKLISFFHKYNCLPHIKQSKATNAIFKHFFHEIDDAFQFVSYTKSQLGQSFYKLKINKIDHVSKIPKPARPLQNNTLKPLGLSDGEYKKNLELIRKPDELNRDIESKPQFSK